MDALPRVSAWGDWVPAPSCARKVKLRPLRGRSFTACVPMVWPTEASSVCSTGGAVVTSTVSDAAPGFNWTSTSRVWLTVRVMLVCVVVANPLAPTVTW